MNPIFRDYSIRNKLMLMMIFTSGIAIFIATVGFMFNERQSKLIDKRKEVQISAQMVALNIGAALVFNDNIAANELLSSLRSDPDILSAKLYDKDGELFSSYQSKSVVSTSTNQITEDGIFEVLQPVLLDHIEIGRLQLKVGKEGMQLAIMKNAGVILSIALFSLLFSILLALWLQRLISGPITRAANKMHRVTESEDYSLRLDWQSNDELGLLANNFNSMLAQVEYRDDQLARQHEVLELKVEERTKQIRTGMEKLQRAEHSLNQIMQAMSQTGEAVLIFSIKGEVEYLNSACEELTGYSSAELKRKPGLLLGADTIGEVWPKVLLGDSWKEEVECSKKDGAKFACLLSLSPITDDSGQVEQVVTILRDLSDREALEEQLRQSQKMESVGVLVGGIAHDFNNLLAGIVGNLELAKIDVDSPDAVTVFLDKIESISFRASETISKLLAFARKNAVQMEVVQLSEFLDEVEHLARVGISEKVELKFDAGSSETWVNADTHQLQQVVLNLLNNAVDAVQMHENNHQPLVELTITKAVPDIALRNRFPTLRKEEYAVIRVRDNGLGILQEHIDKVFEPFFTTKPEGKGTGLGLSMAYGMTQRHGGAMHVESTHGQGSDFIMLLPVVEAPAQEESKALSKSPEALRGNGELVLIADDEALVRDFASSALQRLGYRVLVASDGIEAIALFEEHHLDIDLVILDLVMPRQGGAATAQQIQQLSPEVPIMFVSGYDLNSSMDELDDFQNYFVLQKPYRLYEFGHALREQLSRKFHVT